MAGTGCQTRGNGRAMAAKSAEHPMHYRKGGFVKNPVRKAECAPPAPMPMAQSMPMMPMQKKGAR